MKKKTTKQAKAKKKPIIGKVTFTPPIPFKMLDEVTRIEYANAVIKEISGYMFMYLQRQYENLRLFGHSPIRVCEDLAHDILGLGRSKLIELTDSKLWCEYKTSKSYSYMPLAKNRKMPKGFSPKQMEQEAAARLFMDAIMVSQPCQGHYTEKVVNKPKRCKKPIVRAIVEKYAIGKFDKPSREELKG